MRPEPAAARAKMRELEPADRQGNFNEVELGLTEEEGQAEAHRCLNCGYLHEGPEAPEQCPACAHPQAHFEVLAENW